MRSSLAPALIFILVACQPALPPATPAVATPNLPNPEQPALDVSVDHARTLVLTVRAPKTRQIHIDNCNGAVAWGLVDALDPGHLVWGAEINGCMSPPLMVDRGQTLQLTMLPDLRAPDHGAYRVALFGVRIEAGNEPTQLTSGVLNLGAPNQTSCSVRGEVVQWQADYCLFETGTDDVIAAQPCMDREAAKTYLSACAKKKYYKWSLCEFVVHSHAYSGTVEECIRDRTFSGQTVRRRGA